MQNISSGFIINNMTFYRDQKIYFANMICLKIKWTLHCLYTPKRKTLDGLE